MKPPIRTSRTFGFTGFAGKERANERTRTAYPCSLGVITQALQGVANPAYLEGFLCSRLPRVAPYCVPGGIRVVSKARGSRVAGSLANHAHYHPLPTIKRAGVGVLVALPTLEARLLRAMTSRRSKTKGAKPHPGTDGQNWRPSVQSPFREKGTLPLSETIAHVHASQGGLRYDPCRSRGRHG